MNLCQLTNEQQRKVINIQMEGNVFFDHLLSLGEVRKALDDAYKRIGALTRGDPESMWAQNSFLSEESNDAWDPEMRQRDLSGARIVALVKTCKSKYQGPRRGDARADGRGGRREPPRPDRQRDAEAAVDVGRREAREALLEGRAQWGTPAVQPRHRAAVELATLLQKRKNAELTVEKEKKAAKTKSKDEKAAEKENKAGGAPKPAVAAAAPKPGQPPAVGAAPGAPGAVGADGGGAAAPPEPVASKLWQQIVLRTDEIYLVAEAMQETFVGVVKKLVFDVTKEAEEAERAKILKEIELRRSRTPSRSTNRGPTSTRTASRTASCRRRACPTCSARA